MKRITILLILLSICTIIPTFAQRVSRAIVYQGNKVTASFDANKVDSVVFKTVEDISKEPRILIGEFPYTIPSNSTAKEEIQAAVSSNFDKLVPYEIIGQLWKSTETTNAYKITLIPESLMIVYQWYNNNAFGKDENWDIKENPNENTFTGVTTVTYNNTTYKVYGRYDIFGGTYEYRIKFKE